MTKQQTIELLEKQMPSFYSLEQVIEIVKGISEGSTSLSVDQLEDLVEAINKRVLGELEDTDAPKLVDFDSADFALDCNCISLECIDTHIRVDFEDDIRDVLVNHFEPAKGDTIS
jgi:hypothetical protein